jgi:hypothetical protein
MPSGQEDTMSGLTVSGSPRIGAMVRQSFTAMTPVERARAGQPALVEVPVALP